MKRDHTGKYHQPHAPLTACLSACLLASSQTSASEFSGLVTLTTEYIYRGMTLSDGDPAIQAGVDYEHDSGLFAGIWASSMDVITPVSERKRELDFYAGYISSPDAPLSATVTALYYTYPGQTGARRYDYIELLLSGTWRERHTLEFGYTDDLYGLDRIARHWELRSEWPVANAWVISGAFGGNDLSDAGSGRFLYWHLGASARYERLTFDLRWHDAERPEGFASTYYADSRFVLSISTGF
jgi:uncharacterized protein (TIGR02001 family)